MVKQFGTALDLPQVAAPATPAASRNLLYFKADGKLYKKDSAGVETEVGAGGGAGADEVSVGPTPPANTYELWVDTSAPDAAVSSEQPVLLNGTLPTNLAVAATTVTTIKSWTINNSYGSWAAENASGQFVAPADGYYEIDLYTRFATAAAAVNSYIVVNGAGMVQGVFALNEFHPGGSLHWEGQLSAGATVAFNVYAGVACNVYGTSGAVQAAAKFSIKRVNAGAITGVWQAYAPTVTGMTLGASTVAGRYTRIGNTVHWYAKLVLGTGYVIPGTGGIGVSKPIAGLANVTENINGVLTSTGNNNYVACALNSTTHGYVYVFGGSGAAGNITPTLPFTWKVGDFIEYSGTYEVA